MTPIQDFAFLHNTSAMQRSLLISLQKEVEKFCKLPPIEHKTRITIKRNDIHIYRIVY